MKLLVSDYDKTLTIKNKVLKSDIKYINKFRKKGNIFMISTGRYYESIIEALNKNCLDFDYLSCDYGAQLFDKNLKQLYVIPLNENDLHFLKNKYFSKIDYHQYQDVVISANIFINDKKLYNQTIASLTKNLKESIIEKKYPKIKIINKKCNKINAIEYLKKLYSFSKIITYGDAKEDFLMLKNYEGYVVPNSLKNFPIKKHIKEIIKINLKPLKKPEALCIGFAKCGTTTLYNIFKQNNAVFLSKIKEPIFFGYDKLYNKGFSWYQNRFYKSKKAASVVEINPRIAKYAKASDVKRLYGNVKISIMIRNPIDRLYSNFKMNLRTGKCFFKKKDHLLDNTSILFDKWIKQNFYKEQTGKINYKKSINTNKMLNGNYYEVIKDYINVFGKENVYICIFEKFIKNQEMYTKEMFTFFNIEINNKINYKIHANEGNLIPRSKIDIFINNYFINKFWKDIIINYFPYLNDTFSSLLNNFVWKIPEIFSKQNKTNYRISNYAKKILTSYYLKEINDLSILIDKDLKSIWHI